MDSENGFFMLLNALLGGHGFIPIILLLSLLYLATFKRDSIHNLAAFRLAYLAFAAYLVINPVLSSISLVYAAYSGEFVSGYRNRNSAELGMAFSVLMRAIGPLCLATTFALMMGALIPFSQTRRTPPPALTKHPLDD